MDTFEVELLQRKIRFLNIVDTATGYQVVVPLWKGATVSVSATEGTGNGGQDLPSGCGRMVVWNSKGSFLKCLRVMEQFMK